MSHPSPKILLIDDNHSIRLGLEQMFAFEGYEVQGAENGTDGIAKAQQFLPDLILCDMLMPDLNGHEVLQSLRNNPLTAHIPVLFLTGQATLSDIQQGKDLGAADYLVKPFTIDYVLSAVEKHLKQSAGDTAS